MYTQRGFSYFAIFLSIFLFLSIQFSSIFIQNYFPQKQKEKQFLLETVTEKMPEEILETSITEENEKKEIVEEKTETVESNVWQIEIPAIGLLAPIQEGTTKEVMDQFVGHFEDTAILEGNIGLIAHNRGYPKNYFQNVKDLKQGDNIGYTYQNTKNNYQVETITVIKDIDWSYLEKTEENKITLITCVENEPEYRRCIQGIEIKKGDCKNEKNNI